MVITEMNGDVITGTRYRCIKLSFFEHRCLRGFRTSRSAAPFWVAVTLAYQINDRRAGS
jgi:hypothetical protein